MNKSQWPLTSLGLASSLIACAALLSGCSPAGTAPASAPPVPPTQDAAAAEQPNGPVAIARGKIEVTGGLIELAPGLAGVVQQLPIQEGQSVQREQLLLRLADEVARRDLAVAESEWQLALARAKAKADRLPLLKTTLNRWQTAEREGAADAHSVDQAAQQLRNAQAEADVAQAEVKVAQAKLEQLRALHKRLELRAPEAGTIVRVHTNAGSQVAPNQSVMSLLPNKPLMVRAELNESFVNAVREGMRASVVVDGEAGSDAPALPEAKVLRISPVYGAANLQDDTQRGPVRVVECVLAFEQAPTNARVGQNVRVTFYE